MKLFLTCSWFHWFPALKTSVGDELTKYPDIVNWPLKTFPGKIPFSIRLNMNECYLLWEYNVGFFYHGCKQRTGCFLLITRRARRGNRKSEAVTAIKLLQVVSVVKYSSYCTRSLSFLRFLIFYSCLFRASVLEHCLCPLCCFSLDTTAKSLTLLYRGGKLRTDRAKVQCFFVGKECNSNNLSQFKRICCWTYSSSSYWKESKWRVTESPFWEMNHWQCPNLW